MSDNAVISNMRELCSSRMSLDRWTQLLNATLQWYCEDTRGMSTDERNAGEPLRVLSAWLYRSVVAHGDFHRAYKECCKSRGDDLIGGLSDNALAVQDACNLTGVLLSFVRDIKTLSQAADEGIVARPLSRNAVIMLYADKVCDLAGVKTDTVARKVLFE